MESTKDTITTNSLEKEMSQKLSLDSTSYIKEVRLAVIGNVDSGKSTLVGCLTKNVKDDGRGYARQFVFNYQHETETGRTSSIAEEILGFKDHKPLDIGRTNEKKNISWKEIVEHSENQDKANETPFQGFVHHDMLNIIWMYPDAFHSVLDRAADAVIEDWKDPISNDNINHIQALANNYIQMICLENGEEFGSITKWADLDLLRKAANDSTAQQDYEIILALAEKSPKE